MSISKRSIRNPMDFTPTNFFFKFIKTPAILIVPMFAAYFLGKHNYRVFWIFILSFFIFNFFKRRVKLYVLSLENIYSQIKREKNKEEYETVEWLNHIISKLWKSGEFQVSSMIHSFANKILKVNKPPYLSALKFTELTLGTRPPVIEKINYLDVSEQKIILEGVISFIPISNMKFFKKDEHWNTKIELSAFIKGMIRLPILLQNFTFSGSFRVEMALTKEIPFVSDVKINLLELPVIDYVLEPLKTVDFMDLPILSTFLKTLANKQIQNRLLPPNSVEISLEDINKYQGKDIGIVLVHIGRLECEDNFNKKIELEINGRVFGRSTAKVGNNPIFNEEFCTIIKDTDQVINVNLIEEDKKTGKIFLKNLKKNIYSEAVNLHSLNNLSTDLLNVTTSFHKIIENRNNSFILNVFISKVINLTRKGQSPTLLYNTYVLMKYIRNSVEVETFETKRIFSSKNPIFNENFKFFVNDYENSELLICVMDDKTDTEIGAINLPLIDVHDFNENYYNLQNVSTGEINLKYKMDYIDIHNENINKIININEFNDDDINDINEFNDDINISEFNDINNNNINNNNIINNNNNNNIINNLSLGSFNKDDLINEVIDEIYKEIPEPKKDIKIKNQENLLFFDKKNYSFINFRYAVRFKLLDLDSEGSFYLIFETNTNIFKMEPFTTVIDFNRQIVFPIEDEGAIKLRLFKISKNGDFLIGENFFSLNDSNLLIDRITLKFSIEKEPCEELNPCVDSNYKFLQLKFSSFNSKIRSLRFFHEDREILMNDVFSTFLFVTGKSIPIFITNRTKTEIPQRNAEEEFDLGPVTKEKHLIGNLQVRALTCRFRYREIIAKGTLKVNIIKLVDLDIDFPFVKFYLNNEKIYQTKTLRKDLFFNESFDVNINKNTGVLNISVFSYKNIQSTTLVCFNTFPLYNMSSGFTKYEIPMRDGRSGKSLEGKIQIIFSFSN